MSDPVGHNRDVDVLPARGPGPPTSRLLPASRYLVMLAVIGCIVAAAALFAYGLVAVIRLVFATIATAAADFGRTEHHVVVVVERLAVNLIKLADVFLLGTVVYLVGLGLHLLFINPWLPSHPWIAVQDLDDLKELLVRVIVLLVGVTFLGAFVEHADNVPMMELSVATAIVILAFSVLILVSKLPDWARAKQGEGSRANGKDAT
jgi:uncharacterized membrane protein YqhA